MDVELTAATRPYRAAWSRQPTTVTSPLYQILLTVYGLERARVLQASSTDGKPPGVEPMKRRRRSDRALLLPSSLTFN